MLGSRTKSWAMFTPNGRSVSARILRISSRTASSSPDEVSMMPSAPAFDTADASWERAIQPIGACTIGISTRSIRVTRWSNSPKPPRGTLLALAAIAPAARPAVARLSPVLGAELLVDAHELSALLGREQGADREHRAQALLLEVRLR